MNKRNLTSGILALIICFFIYSLLGFGVNDTIYYFPIILELNDPVF